MISFNGSDPIEFELTDGTKSIVRLIGFHIDSITNNSWFEFEVNGESGRYKDLNDALDQKPWLEHRYI